MPILAKQKMVIVPQQLLVELERARKNLYSMHPDMDITQQINLQDVTDVMWRLSNTRWKEAK